MDSSRGYGGSGPAQTALALVLDYTRDRKAALAHIRTSEFKIVANLTDDSELSGYQISEAIEAIRADRMRNR